MTIWQISPFRYDKDEYYNKKWWRKNVKHELIGLGWGSLGDLRKFSDINVLSRQLKRNHSYTITSKKHDANSCWQFSHNIKEGDIIIAKKGSSKSIYGIGVVPKNGEYKFYEKPIRKDFEQHIIKVKWLIYFELPKKLELSKNFVQWTVNILDKEAYMEIKNNLIEIDQRFKQKLEQLKDEDSQTQITIPEKWLDFTIEEKVKLFDEIFDSETHSKKMDAYKKFLQLFSDHAKIMPEMIYDPHTGNKNTLHHLLEYDIPGSMKIGSDNTWKSAKYDFEKVKTIIKILKNNEKPISVKFNEAINVNLKFFREGAISKLLSAYYPKEIVPSFNNEHKKWFLQILGIPYKERYETIGEEYEALNSLLIKARNKYCPYFDLAKFMEFLYDKRLFVTPKKKSSENLKKEIRLFIRKEREKIISNMEKENDIKKLLEEAKNYGNVLPGYRFKNGQNTIKQRIDDEKQKARIKKIESFTCQIKKCTFYCTYINESGKNIPIIHAHHINSKHSGGNENIKNIIILCPNCHAKADKGLIKIDVDNKIVTENELPIEINDNHLFVN